METTTQNESPQEPPERPLYSTGKKIVFIGALLVWGGFFLPWFSSITIHAKSAPAPSGAEIPYLLGWVALGMAFLVVILPDSFPELGAGALKAISLAALGLGAASLCFLLFNNPGGVRSGVICNIAGYAFLFVGAVLDLAARAGPTTPLGL